MTSEFKFKPGVKQTEMPNKRQILMLIAEEIEGDQNILKWIWEHTHSEDQYDYIREVLYDLAHLDEQLGNWVYEEVSEE